MQFIIFTFLAALVAIGIQRLSRETAARNKAFTGKKPEKEALAAQEMTPCTACGAYVIKNGSSCGRADCPFPSGLKH